DRDGPRRAPPGLGAARRVVEGRHHQDEVRLSAQERRAVQCRRPHDGVLRSFRCSQRGIAARRLDRGRRSHVSGDAVLDEHAFQETERRVGMESKAVFRSMTQELSMQRPIRRVSALVVAVLCVTVHGQAPPADRTAAGPAPGVDISGYWTAPLHEDALERGAGPELGDYGGFPINEAARLFALSYDASRVTLRHHQCDGYVGPYSIRSIGNARAWEERDPHTQRLIAIHWYNQTFEG